MRTSLRPAPSGARSAGSPRARAGTCAEPRARRRGSARPSRDGRASAASRVPSRSERCAYRSPSTQRPLRVSAQPSASSASMLGRSACTRLSATSDPRSRTPWSTSRSAVSRSVRTPLATRAVARSTPQETVLTRRGSLVADEPVEIAERRGRLRQRRRLGDGREDRDPRGAVGRAPPRSAPGRPAPGRTSGATERTSVLAPRAGDVAAFRTGACRAASASTPQARVPSGRPRVRASSSRRLRAAARAAPARTRRGRMRRSRACARRRGRTRRTRPRSVRARRARRRRCRASRQARERARARDEQARARRRNSCRLSATVARPRTATGSAGSSAAASRNASSARV